MAAALTPGEMIRHWFEEVWNQRAADRIPLYLAAHAVIHATDEEGGDTQGPEGFRRFQERMLAAFPDIQFTILDVIEDDSRAVARWSATLTHCGIGMGEPTGGRITVTGMSMVRMGNGIGVEGWNEWDRLSLALACRHVVRAA